jgi:ketosteroid isomerase-like protein
MYNVAMKSLHALVLAAFVGLTGVLFTPVAARAAGIDENAKALAKVDDDWSLSAAKRDADYLASFYAEDAVVYPPNDVLMVGRPAAKKYWAAALADPTYHISWKTVSAGIAKSGDLGFTGGTYEESYKGSDGKLVRNTGKYISVWAKDQNGDWKSIHDIWNPDK